MHTPKPIDRLAAEIGIHSEELEAYGHTKAKVAIGIIFKRVILLTYFKLKFFKIIYFGLRYLLNYWNVFKDVLMENMLLLLVLIQLP